ncbi:MAG: PDZ domain-containing protein [Puia sp.]|nr:PDZ domain-containing protein [Puia sp.]
MYKIARIALFVLLMGAIDKGSAQRINYIVSFPNLSHHEARIQLIVTDLNTRSTVFRMSRSSPGRYATHEFGKNVYDVQAFDEQGKPLPLSRQDGDVYEVSRHGSYVRIEYTLYGNYSDGTYAGIDPTAIHLNMPAAFMWAKGLDNAQILIHFNIPDEFHWSIATQLKPTDNPWTFYAPGLQYFMDCPTRIGNLRFRKWEVRNPDGKNYSFRIAFDAAGSDSLLDAFSGKVGKIVDQARAVYGETPAYDFGTYTFLASINPYVHGDGMEHRNSTMISLGEAFTGSDEETGVFAHEFFHCWNVERIRPKTLEPFNFEKSNMSGELWFAEGFTQYYGELLAHRAGLSSDSDWLHDISALINTKLNTPGATGYSPIEASREAVFTDAGVSVDKTNYPNHFASYYPYGASIALALDLQLRSNYHKTLDDLMRAAWKKYGKTEQPYTIPGLQGLLNDLTGDPGFAKEFFAKYVYGHEPIDYSILLVKAGYLLRKAREGRAWIGNTPFSDKKGLVITRNTMRKTPLYDAGLDIDDQITKLGDRPIHTNDDLITALAAHTPGEKLDIVYLHREEEKTATIVLKEDPALEVVSFENKGMTVSPEMLRFRQDWLNAHEVH